MNLYSQMDRIAAGTSSCQAWRGLVISIVVLCRKIYVVELAGNIGSTGIFQAEVRVLLQGLNLAWDRGFYRVEVEPDNALLIELVKLRLDDPHLARIGGSLRIDMVVYDHPPSRLVHYLERDTRGSPCLAEQNKAA
ncbi:hypothetical protein J1N35_018109 [Gossypium stocksii]|uniref:RNase H type-1 domain-containing protein n=1 Tax=Gossypium stocksii TaxID=47602 RepID=A0A9D3VPA4_9ROSI|nr:hypothetical protein J1N35_018109 [Gossypium stocksii]